MITQFRAVAPPAPWSVVPPTVNVPAATVSVIVVVAVVGWAVKLPVMLNDAVPVNVKVIFAAAIAGLRFALPAESVTPVAIVTL